MEKVKLHKVPHKIKELIKNWEYDKFIEAIEWNWEYLYLFKKDFKFFLLDKKWRNKFIPQDWIYEDNNWTSFHIEKDIDETYYLVVDLSGVNLYFDENWEKYKPKNPLKITKKALIQIFLDFYNKLWIATIFSPKTIKPHNIPENNNINYKK